VGRDAGTDAGRDSGIDAGRDSGTDAGRDAGTCPLPPLPTSPMACFKPCLSDVDCVYVSTSCCCSCASGGASVAINASFESIWAARMAGMCTVDCRGVLCMDVYLCPPGPPVCIAGQCLEGGAG